MPLYRYEALDRTGNKVVGAMQVTDEGALSTRLVSMGYQPTLVQEATGNAGKAGTAHRVATSVGRSGTVSGPPSGSRAGADDRSLARMHQQLHVTFRAGMPAFQVFHTVSGQVAHPALRQALYEIALAVRDGGTISDQMQQYPRLFRPGDVGIVRAAEVGGFLPEAFASIAARYEQEDNAQRRLMLFTGFFHVSIFCFFLLLPMVWAIQAAIPALDVRAGIPAGVTAFMSITVPCCLGYGGFLAWLRHIRRSPERAMAWHRFLLRVPIVGKLNRLRSTAVFTRTLQWLYAAGVMPDRAWETASCAVPNVYLSERFMEGKTAVQSSARISAGMQQTGLLELADVGMVATGESTGEVPEALRYLADRYDEEVKAALNAGVVRSAISFVAWSLLLTPIAMLLLYGAYARAALKLIAE